MLLEETEQFLKAIKMPQKAIIILFNIIKLYLIFSSLYIECRQRQIYSEFSYITLKTNVTGYSKIFSDEYPCGPDEVWINNINLSDTRINEYFLNNSNDIVKLIWYEEPFTMNSIFKNCINISEIDLSHFDASQIDDMKYMFYGCSSLTSLDLSDFETGQVIEMNFMFYGCSALTSLDLSDFDTGQVCDMNSIFYGCSSLTSLDLSNFDTSNVFNMNSMFSGCSSLSSLDISLFSFQNIPINNIFNGCTNLEFINMENVDAQNNNIISLIINSISNNLLVCSKGIELEDIFTNKNLVNCMNKTNEDDILNKCYTNKTNLYNKHSCEICGSNFYQKYNDLNNSDYNINCYESLKDYCPFKFYYNLTSNMFHCTIDENCPIHYNKLIIEKHQCIDICEKDPIYKYEFNNSCFDLFNYGLIDKNNKTNEKENKTEIINNIISDLIIDFDKTDLDNGNDKKKVIGNNLTIILTSTLNQKNNEDINNITMNLGQCENILKSNYNISNNDSLFILQIISKEEGMKIPKIEYEIYYPLYNQTNLTKLNISFCKGSKVEISIAVKINNKLEKYNLSSDYYNDICSKTTSENGTDIPLKDRRNEFVENNMSLCEENCDLIDYNFNTEKAKCSCDIKLNIPSNYDIKFNKKDFLKSFIDVKNIFNFEVLKCYKTVFKIKSLFKNYGFFIISFVIVFYFLHLFIFINISYYKIKKEISIIILALTTNENSTMIKHVIKKRVKIKKKKKKKIKIKKKEYKKKDNTYNKKINPIKLAKEKTSKYSGQITMNIDYDNSCKKINLINNEIITVGNTSNFNILKNKDFELNSLDYEEALQIDHRNYCEYYISLIKYNHPIMFSFAPYNDYNSKIIKIFLFFFSFCLDFTINALFFSDDTMHKIYEDKGKFDFLYQMPQILYSTIISKVIDSLIRKFALSQDNIVELKNQKGSIDLKKIKSKILRILKIKFILFFTSAFIILILFWYYITCFCGIYVNTQIHLIKDSGSSLLLSLFIPFALYLIPGIFRIIALKMGTNKKKSKKFLYDFSLFIENYLG